MSIGLSFAPGLEARARLGFVTLQGVRVREADDTLQAEVAEACRGFQQRFAGVASGDVPGVAEARALYKALGLDPTKTRPSNEALLRRALKGEPLYRVNTLVDALNLCSLREQLPFGLYDLDHVRGPVTFRLGGRGEGYEGIRKGFINLEGRPLLADEAGPFGNPSADSARTSIRLETTQALVVGFAPARWPREAVSALMDRTAATLVRFCGGTAGPINVLP